MKGNLGMFRLRGNKIVFAILLICFVICLTIVGIGNISFSSDDAYAIATSYTQNGGFIQSVDRSVTGVYSKDNAFTILGIDGTHFGDFISEGGATPVLTGDPSTGDNGITRIDSIAGGEKLVSYIGIQPSSEFVEAILDPTVVVKIKPYFIYADPTYKDGEDACACKVTYYSGEVDPDTGDPISYSVNTTNNFGGAAANNPKRYSGSLTLPNVYIPAGDPYITWELSDFQTGGSQFSIAIRSMGLEIAYTPDTNLSIFTDEEETKVINIDGTRHADAELDKVKAGDYICISTYLQKGSEELQINQNTDGTGSVVGKFYRKLYLTDDANTETFLRWTYNSTQLRRVNSVPNTSLPDIASDMSGAIIYLEVLSSTKQDINISAEFWRYDSEPISILQQWSFSLDYQASNAPMLDSSSFFYEKYIENAAYYTNKDSYVIENIENADHTYTEKITKVNLGAATVKPTFSESSLILNGSSTQVTYYRVSRLPDGDEAPTYGQASLGFLPAESNGIYCSVTPDGFVQYSDLMLDLTEEVTLYGEWEGEYDGEGNKIYPVIGSETVYHTDGIFSIEFVTYDFVGNKRIGNVVYFLYVDVADYDFTVKLQLGDGSAVDKQVSTSDVTITYASVTDENKLTAFSSFAVFKRGDKVAVKVRFNATSFNTFFLTYFSCRSLGISTTDLVYDGYSVTIVQTGQMYAFEVSNLYSENAEARKLTLVFKQKATVVVSNLTQSFDGTGKAVKATLKTDNVIAGVNITVSYSMYADRDFSTALPVNAGTYYYKAELLNHSRYYGQRTGEFVILPALPNINSVAISTLEYGESMAKLDFDENLTMISGGYSQTISQYITCLNLIDDRYYYYMSADGVPGYFQITGIDKASEGYIKPTAGRKEIRISFYALKTDKTITDRVVFLRTAEGYYIKDSNYDVVTKMVYLTVNNSNSVVFTASDAVENIVNTDYNGLAQDIVFTIVSSIEKEDGEWIDLKEFATVYYKLSDADDETYVVEKPINAGEYTIKIILNEAKCNYTGTWIVTLIINKKMLDVFASDVNCIFQEESNPVVTASTGTGQNKVVYNGLNYQFTYYYYDTFADTYDDMAIIDNIVPSSVMFDNVPVNAGKYLVKVELNEINYQNSYEVFSILNIAMVNSSNRRLSVAYPAIVFNADNLDCHIAYLQPLSEISISTNWNVKYSYHKYVNDRLTNVLENVNGYFVIVARKYNGLDKNGNSQTAEQYLEEMAAYDQTVTGSHLMYYCFVPSAENSANFEFIYRECEIVIGKAKADFTDVSIEEIVYGKIVGSITDLTISKAIRIKKTGGSSPTYFTLPSDDSSLGYSLRLNVITSENPVLYVVGSHYIDVKFTPNDSDNFNSIVYSCTLSVRKRTLNVSFGTENYDVDSASYVYTYRNYNPPSVVLGNKVQNADVINGDYTYFLTSDGTPYTEQYLTVNNYRAVYTINNVNYEGQASFDIRINKDELIPNQTPAIYEENTNVSYNKLLKNVVFNNGIMLAKNTNEQVSGTYKLLCSDTEVFTLTGIRKQYSLYFTPIDTVNYESYGLNGSFKIYLTVAKANVSDGLSVFIPEYTYGELMYDFVPEDEFSYTTAILTNGTQYTDTPTDGYTYLTVSYTVNGIPLMGKVGAGEYKVVTDIIDDNYTGQVVSYMKINKKSANILVVDNDKEFSNKAQTVTVGIEDVDGFVVQETVLQQFSQNDVLLEYNPTNIGKYSVELSLHSENYKADTVITDFTIRVDASQIVVSNVEQTYSIQRNLGISLGLNEAIYSVSFSDRANGTVYTVMPTNAGVYDIRLSFLADDNYGYSDIIVYSEPLTINKYLAEITLNSPPTTVYSGRMYVLNYTTKPYGLEIVKTFKAEGDDEYSSDEVLEVGQHSVKLTINAANYRGELTFAYTITPANLTVARNPVFGNYIYNSAIEPTLISVGEIDFGTAQRNLEGDYSIPLEDINTLSVGIHTVNYTFVAKNGAEVNKNFNPISGQVTLIIEKQTVSADDIIIGEESGFYINYDGKYHVVDAYIRDGAIYDKNGVNSDLTLTVYYNDSTNRPREKGEYIVKVAINSKNYSGEKISDNNYVVDYGNPEIRVFPSVLNDDFAVGDTITTADITGGKAYLTGTDTQINGSFAVTSMTFTKANINKVQIQFEPELNYLYNNVTFEMDVDVLGEYPLTGITEGADWTAKTISVIHGGNDYGTVQIVATPKNDDVLHFGCMLSDFELHFVTQTTGISDPAEYLDSFGLLTFKNPSAVLNVDDLAEIVYIPSGANSDIYNIMSGYIDVDIQKADLPSTVTYSLKGFLGKTLTQENRIFQIYNNNLLLDINGTVMLGMYTNGEFIDVETALQTEIMISDYNGIELYFKFDSSNYNTVISPIILEIYEEITLESILIGKTTKNYDGKALTGVDFEVSIVNTQLPVDADAISLRVLDAEGNDSDGIEVGVYTVTVFVNDEVYYGSANFTFEITKKDISSDIALSTTEMVYNSIINPTVIVENVALAASKYKMYFKEESAANSSYSLNIPTEAGKYNVKVIVSDENYEGEKVFILNIKQLDVRMISNAVYSYVYGSNVAPDISFKYKDSETVLSLDYEIYYYSTLYTMTKSLPENAGEYKARVVLTDKNYTLNETLGYSEFNYNVTQMVTAITVLPQAISLGTGSNSYNLKYGQRLSELRLIGGEATRLGVSVAGTFGVENGNSILEAGNHTVTVVFNPTDANYAKSTEIITVTVAPADATVVFSSLFAYYTGASRRNAVSYTVSPAGVSVSLIFKNSLGYVVENPIDAGNYSVSVVSNNKNYSVTTAVTADGLGTPILMIAKAKPVVSKVKNPKANNISVGDSLVKSSLIAGADYGIVYYEGFTNPVSGSFSFVQTALPFMTAGTFLTEYVFTPADSNNFAQYTGITEITVNRAQATITIQNNTFTYASGFRYPTFTTDPSGLTVAHDITFNQYDPSSPGYIFNDSDIVDVGTYYFHVWVEDDNYLETKTEFSIVIEKKSLDMNFIMISGTDKTIITQYSTTYGKLLEAKFLLYNVYNTEGKSGYLLKDEFVNGINIADTYEMSYVSTEGVSIYNSHKAPSNIGTYYVTANLINKNYTSTKTISYKVERGIIEDIYFDTNTLENQIYGQTVAPIITTNPARVSYYIVYQGYNTVMPTDAGSYNITVYFNDDNYEKKQVSAMFKINKKELSIINIEAYDKVYDGVSSIKVTGELFGVLYKDEVSLEMVANTLNGETAAGSHYIMISEYKLTGLQAANYDLTEPDYDIQINITSNKVQASSNSSFITSSDGFKEGTTVDFNRVSSSQNKTNILTRAMGTESVIMGYKIKENGAETILGEQFKVYMAIPEEFLGKDFKVEATGNLAGQTVIFTQEGNYITFYASSSGQVVFTKSEFEYTFVVLVAAIAIMIIGIIVLFILNPLQKASATRGTEAQRAAIKKIKKGY